MALDSAALNTLITGKLTAAGFDLSASEADTMAQAIAEAVVEHITSSAEVAVTSGSSAGTYTVA